MTKRSVAIAGHRTSVSLEEPFWEALGSIAQLRTSSLAGLVAEIDRQRPSGMNLSAAIRIFVLNWYRERAEARGPEGTMAGAAIRQAAVRAG